MTRQAAWVGLPIGVTLLLVGLGGVWWGVRHRGEPDGPQAVRGGLATLALSVAVLAFSVAWR